MPDQEEQITALAETNFRHERRRFGIKQDDRRRHVYLIGKTGMGKSTVLENMIIQDIKNGHGVAVVDPHGDLVEKVVNFIPNERINDVIYFNPADLEYPIAFNVFERVDKEHQHLIASGLIGIFKKLWADSWGPRLEYVLRNAILALLEYPESTLLGVMRILTDKGYRKKVLGHVTDPVVRSFWIDEYSKYPDKFQAEAIAPIQNKVGQFLSSPVIRNIVGQVKSSFSLREVMDNKKVLLLNLAKGRVGEDNSALLGAMLITKIQMAAMSRVDIPERDREDFYLYVDEFQNFATESFAAILSEARKYRLNLIIAHQYIEQLDEKVQAAVFGNVGTIMAFRVGGTDAEAMLKEFEPQFTEEDLVNLGKYDVYMKLMIDGIASQPFSATTLPPLGGETDNREKVIKVTRERYSTKRDVVEDKIMRWSEAGRLGSEEKEEKEESRAPGHNRERARAAPRSIREAERHKVIPVPQSAKREPAPATDKEAKNNPNNFKFEAQCEICGAETRLSFQPDASRPIYCKPCLKKVRSGELPRLEPAEEAARHKASVPVPKNKQEDSDTSASPSALAPDVTIPGSDVIDTGPAVSLSQALSQGVKKFKG